MTDRAQALDKYKALIRQAEELERMASDNAAGGSTYWSSMYDCTRGAIASADFIPTKNTHRLSTEAIRAINFVATHHFDPIWQAAAQQLRERAKDMKDGLEKQAAEIAAALRDLTTQECSTAVELKTDKAENVCPLCQGDWDSGRMSCMGCDKGVVPKRA